MSRLFRLAAPLLIAACAATPVAEGPPSPLLAGTIAGKSTRCLDQRLITDQRIVDERTILFRASRWYRNDLPERCTGLREGRTIVTRTVGGDTCSGDIISVVDLPSGIGYGACSLGRFTPYDLPPGVRP